MRIYCTSPLCQCVPLYLELIYLRDRLIVPEIWFWLIHLLTGSLPEVCFSTRLPANSSSPTACWQGDRATTLRPEQEPGRGRMLASNTPVTGLVVEKHKTVQQRKHSHRHHQLLKAMLKQSTVSAVFILAIRCITEMQEPMPEKPCRVKPQKCLWQFLPVTWRIASRHVWVYRAVKTP